MAKFLSVEVGLTQVRVVRVEQKGKKSKLSSSFYFSTPQGAVEDGYIRDTQGIGETLKKELKERRLKVKKVCFAVSSSRIASREVRLPLVKETRLQSIIEANATDYFPIDVTKYLLSYHIIDIEEVEGEKQYHLMVYASPKSIAAAYQEMAAYAGLTMVCINYVGDNIYSAVKEEFSQDTHLLMKVEEKNTLITVVENGELTLQRVLNYGMNGAVDAVCSFPVFGTNLDFEAALEVLRTRKCLRESLDESVDLNEPEDTDEFVKEARIEVTESLRYLIGNISRIMDYYLSRHTDVEFASILCCGLGAEIQGFTELLTVELGQRVEVLTNLSGIQSSGLGEQTGLVQYAVAAGAMRSTVNLMEKVSRKEKERKESLSGAALIFTVGLIAGAVLSAAGVGLRIYQEQEQKSLNRKIEEARSIEEIYNAYIQAQSQYSNFQFMYQLTNTPNEGLVPFIEELEQKMPSSITMSSFNSTGTQVSFSMTVQSKSEAANTIMQLRTFESLSEVQTSGISEQEDGTVSMSIVCTYSVPAPLESSGQ